MRWLGGDTEYILAGLPITLVLTFVSWTSEVGEKQLYYSQSRDGIKQEGKISLFPSHDYLEYEKLSKQYENGPMTYFWSNYRLSKAVP